jgi:hypothetical protein
VILALRFAADATPPKVVRPARDQVSDTGQVFAFRDIETAEGAQSFGSVTANAQANSVVAERHRARLRILRSVPLKMTSEGSPNPSASSVKPSVRIVLKIRVLGPVERCSVQR